MSATDSEPTLIADRTWSFERGRLKLTSDLTHTTTNIIAMPNRRS
jgi:hypothetical protein